MPHSPIKIKTVTWGWGSREELPVLNDSITAHDSGNEGGHEKPADAEFLEGKGKQPIESLVGEMTRFNMESLGIFEDKCLICSVPDNQNSYNR
jgi:hypothetical protein